MPRKRSTSLSFKDTISLGFSMTEAMVTVAIAGTIGAIAIPDYITQKNKSCQASPESTINQTMIRLQAYNDEFRSNPEGWID